MTRLRVATADTFRSLQHPNFRLFFVSQSISAIGTWLQLIAQTILIYRLTDSGTALGLLAAVQFVPTLVLGAWAGVVLDRHDKRRVMELTQLVMLAAALALGILVLVDQVTIAWVFGLAAVLGLASTFDNPARRTLVNELVGDEDVGNAVSLYAALVTSARLIGPAVAGVLVATVGIGWCFVINGLSFVAPIVGLRRMDPTAMRLAPPVPRAKGQLRQGLRFAWAVPEVRVPLLMVAVIGTFAYNFQVLFPLLAERDLGGDASTYTWLMATAGLGMLCGSLWLARRTVIDIRLLGLFAAAFGVMYVLLAMAPSIPLALGASFLVGITAVGMFSGSNTVIQLAAEPAVRGRVLALYTVVFLGSTAIGAPIMGALAEHLGARWAIGIAAVLSLATGLAALGYVRGGLAVRRRAPVASPVALGADGTSAAA